MNIALDLPKNRDPADLGPKLYISLGRGQERGVINGGGDAVTRIHCDMADAVNLMLHKSGESHTNLAGKNHFFLPYVEIYMYIYLITTDNF